MKVNKFVTCLFCVFLLLIPSFAQEEQKRVETTAEEDYFSSFEDVIISELTISDDYDNKYLALQYISDALDKADDNRDKTQILKSLNSLAGEGVLSQSRENGRLLNNYPDVRRKACELLGKIKTEESKDTLVKIALADNEPMVVTAAVRSLGDIGINTDEVVTTVAWIQRKYSVINPTSSLALAMLDTYEKIGPTVNNKAVMIQTLSSIATNYKYVTPVREKAKILLEQFTGKKKPSSDKK